MTRHMLTRKRPLSDGNGNEVISKKSLAHLKAELGRHQTNKATETLTLKSGCSSPCENGRTDTKTFSEHISSWADTQQAVKTVLDNLKLGPNNNDTLLSSSVNEKFLEFHRDVTEECGAEDKQHSWAVIEKQEEIIIYGPYYPNYNNGLHSEDVIIKQTQELLESEDVSEDWKVYVFTMNSPCLARNTEACMLRLVQRAQQWWSRYGIKTHIGYVKCWGFKGVKENLFRDLNYNHVEFIDQAENPESYGKAAGNTDLNPLCEGLFFAVKRLLKVTPCTLINTIQEQDWRSYFKSLHSIDECTTEKSDTLLKQEVDSVIEAAQVLLSEKNGTLTEQLEKGQAFVSDFNFGSDVSQTIQHQIRITFQECYREMLKGKYAEFIKDKLTEEFNQTTVQLFITDVEKFTKEYLHIGRIQFTEDAQNLPH